MVHLKSEVIYGVPSFHGFAVFPQNAFCLPKFPQFHRALLLRVLRVERRVTAKNEALDEFC